jgi:uncharacterized protein (DUF1697 family)
VRERNCRPRRRLNSSPKETMTTQKSDSPESKFVALLRGINVGGNRVIKSLELKECLEGMRLTSVEVFLASGNVIFESSAADLVELTALIEKSLEASFGYPAKVIVLKLSTLARIVEEQPFVATEGWHRLVVFLTKNIARELVTAVRPNAAVEQVEAGKCVVYWTVERGMTLKSDFGKLLSKAKYKNFNTVRNINTLVKMLE